MSSQEKIPLELITKYANSINALRRYKLREIINPVERKPSVDLHYVLIAPNSPPERQVLGFAIAKVVNISHGIDLGDNSMPSLSKRYVAINEFFVHPDYQRQGYGSEMIRLIRKEAEALDCTHLRIYRMQEPSVNLFLKLAARYHQNGMADRYWIRPLKNLAERFIKRRPDGIIEFG
jgi:GNAT superfamily N-acetyltransferase